MPTKKIEVSFDLTDYFSKFGFGDGDDGAALDEGYANRGMAVEIINQELKRAKSKATAAESDPGTIHNPCRIDIVLESVSLRGLEIDDDSLIVGDCQDLPNGEEAKINKALAAARVRFEKEAS